MTRTKEQQIQFYASKLEGLANRDYVGRQRLLLMLHELRNQIDDDCPAPQGQ